MLSWNSLLVVPTGQVDGSRHQRHNSALSCSYGLALEIVPFSLGPGLDRNARDTIVYCSISKRLGGGPRGFAALSPGTQTLAGDDWGLAHS